MERREGGEREGQAALPFQHVRVGEATGDVILAPHSALTALPTPRVRHQPNETAGSGPKRRGSEPKRCEPMARTRRLSPQPPWLEGRLLGRACVILLSVRISTWFTARSTSFTFSPT